MDTYINASSWGICHRKVSEEFFGNRPGACHGLLVECSRIDPRSASPSLACSNEDCPRCKVTVSRLCCDTCNPGSFILPVPATTAPRQSRAPNQFKLNKSCKMSEADKSLTFALREWRVAQLVRIGIPAGDDMYGSQLIMTDDILECIVGLVHHNQLADLASIKAQVNWRYNDLWGTQILEIVNQHAPLTDSAVTTSHTLQPTGAENIPGPSAFHQSPHAQSGTTALLQNDPDTKLRTRNRYKCSTCGSSTHIGTPVLSMFTFELYHLNLS